MRGRRCLLAASIFVPGIAHAQGFAVDRYEPADRGAGWLVVDQLDFEGHQRPAAGLTLDYAHKPLVAYDAVGNERRALVRHQAVTHLGGSIVILERLRLAVNLPFALYQDGEPAVVRGQPLSAAAEPALGDVRLGADGRIVSLSDVVTLAGGLRVWLPTGSRRQLMGDGTTRAGPQLLSSGRVGVLVWAARLALVVRGRDTYAGHAIGTELGGGVGAGVRIASWSIGPEVFASTSLGGFFQAQETPVEALLGAHYSHSSGLRAGAGFGCGLTQGYGSPAARALFSIEWQEQQAVDKKEEP